MPYHFEQHLIAEVIISNLIGFSVLFSYQYNALEIMIKLLKWQQFGEFLSGSISPELKTKYRIHLTPG